MDISKNMQILRTQRKYSQEEVANKLGVTRQTYIKMENNESSILHWKVSPKIGLNGFSCATHKCSLLTAYAVVYLILSTGSLSINPADSSNLAQ